MKELTREQLQAMVPIIAETVRLEDIPEPYRTEFIKDSIGSTIPAPNAHYVWDWQKWLLTHFRDPPDPGT
jgi:hypothetical protein